MQIFDGPRIKSLESYLRQGYGSTSAELWVLSQCVSSDLAAEQMAAGDAYQAQSDERVERAVMRQKKAQRAVRLACFVVLAIVALVAWFYLQR